MQTDEQRRNDFIAYLKQLKQTWVIEKDAERVIIRSILSHTDSELATYIAHFKRMVGKMESGIDMQTDKYSKNPPADGKCVDSFVGANVTTQDYTSNYSLRLFFSETGKKIYKFEVLC